MMTYTQKNQQPSAEKNKKTDPLRLIISALCNFAIGTFIGFEVAGSTGVVPDSWVPYVLAGYFAVIIVFCAWYARRMINLSSQLVDASQNVNLTGPRALARVGKLQEAGHVVSSFNHEFIFTLTVFPQSAAPYETTIRQFITMGELPNFYTGRFV